MSLRFILPLLAATVAFTTVADAEHRWRKPRYLVEPLDIITAAIGPMEDEDEWSEEIEDDEPTLRDMRERRKRWTRVNDEPWWMSDEDVMDEPKPNKPHVKKPKAKAKAVVPPKPKPKPNAAVAAAAIKAKPIVAKPVVAKPLVAKPVVAKPVLAKAVVTDAPKPVAVIQKPPVAPKLATAPKPSGKTVGCTGGAAIVTGLGFAGVRPRICTGETYAYLASKSDGNYAIKLKAATGEVVDVAKLP